MAARSEPIAWHGESKQWRQVLTWQKGVSGSALGVHARNSSTVVRGRHSGAEKPGGVWAGWMFSGQLCLVGNRDRLEVGAGGSGSRPGVGESIKKVWEIRGWVAVGQTDSHVAAFGGARAGVVRSTAMQRWIGANSAWEGLGLRGISLARAAPVSTLG